MAGDLLFSPLRGLLFFSWPTKHLHPQRQWRSTKTMEPDIQPDSTVSSTKIHDERTYTDSGLSFAIDPDQRPSSDAAPMGNVHHSQTSVIDTDAELIPGLLDSLDTSLLDRFRDTLSQYKQDLGACHLHRALHILLQINLGDS
jgi:hypothetical protein